MRLPVATLIFAAFLADAAPGAWRPPVAGAVTRPFDLGSNPFEAGRHRGVDLAAVPGTTVRAPCGGPVAFAGTAGSNGRVVTLLCGRRRVTHMPLASIAVRSGALVREGTALGTVTASSEHRGLHLGVRRDGTRFGYEDPLPFLVPGRPNNAPPLGPAPRPGRRPHSTPPRPPTPLPHPAAAPRPHPAPAGSNPQLRSPLAPWPAWLGLALVLAGAGFHVRAPRRRRWAPRQPSQGAGPCRS